MEDMLFALVFDTKFFHPKGDINWAFLVNPEAVGGSYQFGFICLTIFSWGC